MREAVLEAIFMLGMLLAIDPELIGNFQAAINVTGKMYAQGVVWEGQNAIRHVIAN